MRTIQLQAATCSFQSSLIYFYNYILSSSWDGSFSVIHFLAAAFCVVVVVEDQSNIKFQLDNFYNNEGQNKKHK